nr:hypothetical protein [uncultured Caproiciproducens sp.]
MIKIKKITFIIVALLLMLEMTGCGNPSLQNGSKAQTNSSQMQSSKTGQMDELPQSSAVPSTQGAVSNDSSVQSKKSENSNQTANTSSQTQQDVLHQINTALNTKVPLMLPISVPVKKDCYLTLITTSQTTNYKVNFYQNDQPANINSKAASSGTLIATVEGTKYKDAASAKESISGYEQADTSNYGELLNLGHNIKAVEDAGLGHQQLIWNEGRWCLRMDSPTDPAFKNKEYPNREQLAKNIVAYLEDQMLPVPQIIGVISINIWNQSYGTTIKWQHKQTVYQISGKDPMTALKVAVAMKFS